MGAVLDLVLDIIIESLEINLKAILKGFLRELALIPALVLLPNTILIRT